MSRAVAMLAVISTVLVTCGGRIEIRQPKGYVDDQGTFRSPDGKPYFTPGVKCAGYDPSSFAKPAPKCTDLNNAPEPCTSWLRSRTPPGYPVSGGCSDFHDPAQPDRSTICGGGVLGGRMVECDWTGCDRKFDTIYCDLGPAGDAFCRGFFSQFVLGDGTVSTRCVGGMSCTRKANGTSMPSEVCTQSFAVCQIDPCSSSGPDATFATNLSMWVIRNGNKACEAPCAAPN
jgi:hypothetical protein